MDGPNPQEMDIKVFIPPPTYYSQFEKMSSINGKRLHISSTQENKIKYKMHDFKNKIIMFVREIIAENINIYHPRAHFIVIYSISSVFTL